MIHLDANLLIALVNPTDLHHAAAVALIRPSCTFGCSAVAWTELRSKPVHHLEIAALKALLAAGIVPFEQSTADLAGDLYHRTGGGRRTRLDSMIAATAILAGAELATVNSADFAPFVPHGLDLLPLG